MSDQERSVSPAENAVHISGENAASKTVLWLVTELYFPEETSTGYYLTRIGEGLTDKFDVKVICGQPNYSARGVRALKHEVLNDVEIFRVAGTGFNKNVILFRLINMLTLSTSVFFRSVRSFSAKDRVLVVTTPPSLPFIAAFASKLRGAVYTLLVHDNYPEILIAAGKSRENSLLVKILEFSNRWLYKHSSKIIAVGRDMRSKLEKKTNGLDIPITFIPNWAELETVHPMPRDDNKLLSELGLLNKFVLLYAGNMGHPNDIETIVSAAAELQGSTDVHFIFLGAGAKEPWLKREIRELALTNVTLLSPKPRSEQLTFLNACDVALVSLVGKMLGVSMPSRTYNIMAAGKPILALTDDNSELAQVINEEGIGLYVRPGDKDMFLAAIERLRSNRSDLKAMSERARAAALSKYSLDTAIAAYSNAIS